MIAQGKNKKQTQRAKNRAKIYKKRTIKKRSFVSCCFFWPGHCQLSSWFFFSGMYAAAAFLSG